MFDGGFDVDLEIVNRNIDEAEVVTVYFPLLQKTLVIDTRTQSGGSSDAMDPLVCVAQMVGSSAERFAWLERVRPGFARPGSITMIPWLRRVGSLQDTGVWAHVVTRIDGSSPHAATEAARCLRQLQALEREEFRFALTGMHYRTLWGRAGRDELAR